MNEKYSPPPMPPFPESYDEVMQTLVPYYREQRPLDYFFELYIVEVLERLPRETSKALDDFSAAHPTFFAAHDGDWRKYVVVEFKLSETINIAIWDLWVVNSTKAEADGWDYHPWHYAQNFCDNYFAEGSRIDVWEGNSLDAAKMRIDEYRKKARS